MWRMKRWVTKAFVGRNELEFKRQLDQAFQILLFITIPAVVGMSVLAGPVYTAFYSHDLLGISVLQAYAPVSILFALFSVSAAVLQGINQQKYTVLSLLVGFLIKLSLNIPLIKLFETEGSVYATAIGYLGAVLLNLYVIKYFTGYQFSLTIRRTILVSFFSAIMGLAVWGLHSLLGLWLSSEGRFQAILISAICSGFGALIYAALSLKSKLAHRLFGTRIDRLKQKLGL